MTDVNHLFENGNRQIEEPISNIQKHLNILFSHSSIYHPLQKYLSDRHTVIMVRTTQPMTSCNCRTNCKTNGRCSCHKQDKAIKGCTELCHQNPKDSQCEDKGRGYREEGGKEKEVEPEEEEEVEPEEEEEVEPEEEEEVEPEEEEEVEPEEEEEPEEEDEEQAENEQMAPTSSELATIFKEIANAVKVLAELQIALLAIKRLIAKQA